MRRLSDLRDEEALDVLADILDPVAEIMRDKQIADAFEPDSKVTMLEVAKMMIKGHKRAVMQIMAVLEGVPFEEYHCNFLTLPINLLKIINDKELKSFFTLQAQMDSESGSGSAMENTEEEDGSDTL